MFSVKLHQLADEQKRRTAAINLKNEDFGWISAEFNEDIGSILLNV